MTHDLPDKYRIQSPEVLYSVGTITTTDRSDVDLFKELSANNLRQRVRLCAHESTDDRLHEMLIVHGRDAYVRPHKHPGKTESMHIIEGLVNLVVFDDEGKVDSVNRMEDYASGATFYYRMAVPLFHTLIIRSDVLVFHETTNGPFDRRDTVFAVWAPEDGDVFGVNSYMTDLDDRIKRMP